MGGKNLNQTAYFCICMLSSFIKDLSQIHLSNT